MKGTDSVPTLDALVGVTASLVSDALDALGLREHTVDPAIRPLVPGPALVGVAVPILIVPSSRIAEPPYETEIRALEDLRPGEVPVYCTAGDVGAALWGELFTCAALGRGATGAVVDGPIRDVRQIRELGFPVFARGFSPLDTLGRAEAEAFRVPATCGGVRIEPGDIVVGDEDGLVVVPRDVAPDVSAAVDEKLRGERSARIDLLAGETLGEVWRRYGVL